MSNLPAVVVPLADKVPTDNNVVAGWVGFAVFMFLVVSVALLLWSFSHQLKKTRTSFGIEDRRPTVPVAGTPEGDAALAEALVGPESTPESSPESSPDEADAGSSATASEPQTGPDAGRHRA